MQLHLVSDLQPDGFPQLWAKEYGLQIYTLLHRNVIKHPATVPLRAPGRRAEVSQCCCGVMAVEAQGSIHSRDAEHAQGEQVN